MPKTKMNAVTFRAKLAEAELSQGEFADHLQVDRKTVNRWSTGHSPVPHHVALTLDQLIRQCKLNLMK